MKSNFQTIQTAQAEESFQWLFFETNFGVLMCVSSREKLLSYTLSIYETLQGQLPLACESSSRLIAVGRHFSLAWLPFFPTWFASPIEKSHLYKMSTDQWRCWLMNARPVHDSKATYQGAVSFLTAWACKANHSKYFYDLSSPNAEVDLNFDQTGLRGWTIFSLIG